jgi:hypothetical protein
MVVYLFSNKITIQKIKSTTWKKRENNPRNKHCVAKRELPSYSNFSSLLQVVLVKMCKLPSFL